VAELNYPSLFAQKVLAHEAPGGKPETVRLTVPTVTVPGRPFTVKVAVTDADALPSLECDDIVTVAWPGGAIEVPFWRGHPAVAAIDGVVLAEESLWRIEAQLDRYPFLSNPTFCTAGPHDPIYWGDPHIHTILSNCHADKCRSLNFCFFGARYLTGLDWASAADHVSNGRCEFSKWREQRTVADVHNDPSAFVTLPCYEASLHGGAGGDNNVYLLRWPEMFVDECDGGNARTLCEKLVERVGERNVFIVPHHTTRSGKHGEIPDEIYPGEALMPVVEIHSKWGTSENRGSRNPLKRLHDGPSYVVDLLARGLRLGFIGGTDSHTTMTLHNPFEPDHIDRLPGLTAVRSPELTREAIFDGIRNRRCYATSQERIYLDVRVADEPMGGLVEWPSNKTPRTIRVRAAGESNIVLIEVVRNGETIHQQPVAPCAWHGETTFTDEEDLSEHWLESKHLGCFATYYARVTTVSGAQAWSSPVWLVAKRR